MASSFQGETSVSVYATTAAECDLDRLLGMHFTGVATARPATEATVSAQSDEAVEPTTIDTDLAELEPIDEAEVCFNRGLEADFFEEGEPEPELAETIPSRLQLIERSPQVELGQPLLEELTGWQIDAVGEINRRAADYQAGLIEEIVRVRQRLGIAV